MGQTFEGQKQPTDEEFELLVVDKLKRQLGPVHYRDIEKRAYTGLLTAENIEVIERARAAVEDDLRALGPNSSAQLGVAPERSEVQFPSARAGARAERNCTSGNGAIPSGEVQFVGRDEVQLRKAKKEEGSQRGSDSLSYPGRNCTSRPHSSHRAEARFEQRQFVASILGSPFVRTSDVVRLAMERFGVSRRTAYNRVREVRDGRMAPYKRVSPRRDR